MPAIIFLFIIKKRDSATYQFSDILLIEVVVDTRLVVATRWVNSLSEQSPCESKFRS